MYKKLMNTQVAVKMEDGSEFNEVVTADFSFVMQYSKRNVGYDTVAMTHTMNEVKLASETTIKNVIAHALSHAVSFGRCEFDDYGGYVSINWKNRFDHDCRAEIELEKSVVGSDKKHYNVIFVEYEVPSLFSYSEPTITRWVPDAQTVVTLKTGHFELYNE